MFLHEFDALPTLGIFAEAIQWIANQFFIDYCELISRSVPSIADL